MNLSLQFSKDVVKACCILHNFVYDRDVIKFEDTLTNASMILDENESLSGSIIREKHANYFCCSEGSLTWHLTAYKTIKYPIIY